MQLEDVQRVTVLGAGNMGHGIAEVAALAGYDVALRDIEEEFVQGGYDQIEWSLGKLAEKDRIGEDEADAALDRVEAFVDLEDSLADADVVVEVVPEKMAIARRTTKSSSTRPRRPSSSPTPPASRSLNSPRSLTGPSASAACTFQPAGADGLGRGHLRKHTSEDTLELIEGLAESMGKLRSASGRTAPGSSSTASSSPPDERGRVDRRVRRRDDRDGRLHDEVRHGAPDGLVRARGPGRYRRGVPRPRIYARGARRGVPTLPTARREGRSRRAGEEDRLGVLRLRERRRGDPHGRDRRRCPQTPARGDGQRGRRTRRQRRGRRARDRSCRDARRRIPGRSRKARR